MPILSPETGDGATPNRSLFLFGDAKSEAIVLPKRADCSSFCLSSTSSDCMRRSMASSFLIIAFFADSSALDFFAAPRS